jgi:hypothetical protein
MTTRRTRTQICTGFALAALAAGCSTPPEVAEVAEATGALAPNIRIAGHVAAAGSPAVPVAGVRVQLNGSLQRTAITDSNGNYMFEVPAGSYSLNPTRAGSLLSPDVVNLNNLAADKLQDFTCTSGCAAPASIVGAKELVITDPSVLNDARASNAADGPWSFRFLLEQMTPPGVDPTDFVTAWLQEFTAPPPAGKTVNGFPVDDRDLQGGLLLFWPKRADGKIDLAQAPFNLLAVVNRTDLHPTGTGEGRLVFGLIDKITIPQGLRRAMTVIFEFGLPTVDPVTQQPLARKDWVAKFHALGGKTFGVDYNPALQAVTDAFTRRNTSPSRPNGSSLNQLRSNEVVMTPGGTATGGVWQAREFHLAAGAAGGLKLASPSQTPDDSAAVLGTATNAALTNYLNSDGTRIRVGYATVPPAIVGGQSTETFSWVNFAAPVDPAVRHAFAGQTCSGCHFNENFNLNINTFYLITPLVDPGDGTAHLSDFVKLVEIPRRALFAQNQLTCTGSACAPGAEPMILP